MRSLKALLVATVFAGLPVAAHAQWYMGADVGANYAEDADVSANNSTITADTEWGWVGLGQVGHQFGPWKIEGELGARRNDFDNAATTGGSGDINSFSMMGNVIHEFMQGNAWRPFVGAGIGWAWLDMDGARNNTVTVSDNDNQFAYQGFAGLAYDVTENVAIKGQYRYFATLDPEFRGNNGVKYEGEYANHSLLVGLTYSFGAPAAPAPAPVVAAQPAPAPKPAPAPAPVAMPSEFMVFFDWDRAAVTPEANRILQEAAAVARKGQASRIALTGHADRSGAEPYNLKLSQSRAEAVKAQLVSLGVPANQISVVAKGESDPLVATPDGVREPQNRRVEILLP